MFKLKYKGQEIGLDTDCRIEWDSVKTDSSNTLTGWSGSHEEIDRFVNAEYMIKFKKESAGHPDYMRIVGAEMDREYNVFDFIDEILKRYPKDYGRIDIDGKISYEYKNGVLDWALIPQELFNRVVEKVEGMSCYYNTDYKLTLKGDKPKEEVEKRMGIEDILDEIGAEMQEMKRKYEEKYGMNIASILVSKYGEKSFKANSESGVFEFDIVV